MNKKLSRILLLSMVMVLVASSFSFSRELNIEDRTNAYLVGDYETGLILESNNIEEPIEIASITKIMSYLVVADEIELGNINLDDTVYIDEEIARVAGSSLKLRMGEKMTVDELLKGLMVVSGNDATYALAKHTYGTEKDFVEQMMLKAEELGLKSAVFYNSTGLPEPSPTGNPDDRKQNMMSPRDIFSLARHIIRTHPEVLELSSMVELKMPKRGFEKHNTNDLLVTMPGVDGFKTGFTDKAGFCLVSTMSNGLKSKDSRLISVVMGTSSAKERSKVTRELLEYASDNYERKELLDEDRPTKILPMKKVESGHLKIYPKEGYEEIISSKDTLDMDIKLNRFLSPSFKKGDVVGRATIFKNNKEIKEVDLIVKEDIIRQTFFGRLFAKLRRMFTRS